MSFFERHILKPTQQEREMLGDECI